MTALKLNAKIVLMKVVVDEKKCLGCGTCVAIASKSFRLNNTAKAEPIEPAGDPETKVKEAVESCPVSAISILQE